MRFALFVALFTLVLGIPSTSFAQATASRAVQEVALVAEPVASVPSLYPGKAPIPLEGTVRMVGVANFKNANGKAIDPATLSYTWTVDGTIALNSSGTGKNALIVASPLQYRNRSVSLVVQTADGARSAEASFSLAPRSPTVRIYENDPLLGIRYDRALSGNKRIRGSEVSLYAGTFGLPLTSGAPSIEWFLNGTSAQTGHVVTLRPSGEGRGSATLSVVAASGENSKTNETLSLSFETEPSNFFGL